MAKASQAVILENEFYIIKAPNGKVLEVKNFNTENGAAIQLWNTANGAQAQIWNFVAGGNQEWTLERIDPDTAQSGRRAEEAKDPQPTPSQRKHQNDLVRKLNNAGKGRASRKGQ